MYSEQFYRLDERTEPSLSLASRSLAARRGDHSSIVIVSLAELLAAAYEREEGRRSSLASGKFQCFHTSVSHKL